MKKHVFSVFFFLSSFFFSYSQSQFQITYNYDGFDVVSSVKNTPGGYIAAGWAYGTVNFLPVGIAIETDLLGNVVWAKRYTGGFLTPHAIWDMQKTAAGGYIATGFRGSRALLMNLSSTGTVNWAKGAGNNNDGGTSVKETAAGDFVVAGSTSNKSLNPDKDSTSIYVFKYNNGGTYQWGRTYTLSSPVFDSHDAASDVVEVSGGGYVFTGYLSENNGADTTSDILLFKTDASGTLQWMKSYGALGDYESGNKIIQLAGGDLLIAGYTDKTGLGDIFLLRTDASGNYISSSSYNVGLLLSPEVNSLVQTSDGGFALFGWTITSLLNPYRPFVLKLNSSMGIQFTKHYNSQLSGFFVRGEEATSGGYIIAGMTAGATNWDFNLIKTDSNGNSGCNEVNYSATAKVYTPPAANIIPVVYSVGGSSNLTITVSNISPTPTVVCSTTPPVATAGSNQTICSGGSIVIGGSPTATGGTAPYTYAWTPSASLNFSNIANPTASPASTTTYTVIVTDANANTSTSTTTVFVNPSPTASAGSGTSICPGIGTPIGGSPTATGGTPGYNYAWSPSGSLSASNIANPVATPGSTTTYTVIVTDALGCTSSSQVTVNVFTAPSAIISGNTNICAGDATTLTAFGGGTYFWSTTATSPSIVVSPAVTTTYTVIVTDGNGCTNSTTSTVTVNSAPTAIISGSTAICAGDVATLTASGGTSYSWWNNGATSATITDAPATNTTYTVTVSNGSCSSTTSSTVTVNPLPIASISGNINICQGETTTLTALGGGTYLWDNSATTVSITVNPATTTSYTVTVTSANGCAATATATVFVAPPPVASVSGNTTLCAGQSTVLTASGGLTYSWNTTATTSSITVSPAASTTYSVIVSAGTCSDTASISVTVNPTPVANINTASTSICTGQNATLTATGVGTYSWSTGVTTNPIIVSPTGATSYSVIVSNGNCTDTASVNISVLPPVTATASGSADTICSGQSATLTASGGTIYSWSSGQTTSSISLTLTSTSTFTVIVSNGSCADTATASITVNQSPTANITGNNIICAGQSTTLTASGGGTYSWNTGAITTTISVSQTSSTSYTVTVTSTNGCTASATSSVTVTPFPIPTVTVSASTICSGEAIILTAGGGTTYLWNPGNQTTSSIQVNPAISTTYTVTAAIGSCTATASTTVNVNPSPTANTAGVTVNYGSTSTISATPAGGTPPYTYVWDTGDLTSVISVSPTITTVYCVTISDANGCSDTACAIVTVDYVCGELFIPNAFSPNEDGKNDYFHPRNICFTTFHLIIYDRWGVKVYDKVDDPIGWDGMYKGSIGETAVFNYYFSYELADGNYGVKKGTVSLIR